MFQGIILAFAAGLPALSYALQGAAGLGLADEGFLWYGAQRVMTGEVPIRDFQAYDVGRYYWAAGLMSALGSNGILALRITNAALLALGVMLATHMVTRPPQRVGIVYSIFAGSTFMLWMVPDYKAADFTASIALIFAIAYAVEMPTPRRFFICGVMVGVAAILGRNHGLYGAVASFAVIAYSAYRQVGVRPLPALLALLVGMFVGYLPMLVALAATPGFAHAFWESIRFLFEYKATNIALPLPWPWRVSFDHQPLIKALHQVLVGTLFAGLLCFGLIGLLYLVRSRLSKNATFSPVFVSSVLLVFPYAHYAFSRADLPHLAFGVFPFLVGVMTFPTSASRCSRAAVLGILFAISITIMLPVQPGIRALREPGQEMVAVGDDTLKVNAETAWRIKLIDSLADRYASNGHSLFVAPFWPGAYALLERKSPTWEICGLFPRTESFEEAEIARIKAANVGLIIINDIPPSGRDDLRYKNTHPAIERYIRSTFQPLSNSIPTPRLQIYARRGVDQL